MAERRMFAKSIIDSDLFLDMPATTQNLYFHLAMRADDDGFVNAPQKIMRFVSCSKNDMDLLIVKNFIIPFETGICVIKHWKIHNYLRSDRYTPTIYTDERNQLLLDTDSKVYIRSTDGIPTGIPHVIPVVDVGKVSKGKRSKDNKNIDDADASVETSKFKKPSISEIEDYCTNRKNGIDAEEFFYHYESKGWKIGKEPMKNWKAAVITWEKKQKESSKNSNVGKTGQTTYYQPGEYEAQQAARMAKMRTDEYGVYPPVEFGEPL